jgi:hypothetical protein
MKRLMLSLTLAAGLLVPAGHVFADPTNAPDARTVVLDCGPPLGTVTIAVNTGQAGQQGTASPLTPAFIIEGGTGKNIGISLTIGSQTLTRGNAQGPQTPQGMPVTCTFNGGNVTAYWLPH